MLQLLKSVTTRVFTWPDPALEINAKLSTSEFAIKFLHAEISQPHARKIANKLRLTRLSSLDCENADLLCREGRVFEISDQSYLVCANRTYRSSSGRYISLVEGRSLSSQEKIVFAAFPERADLLGFRQTSQSLAVSKGPGDMFHGSIGVAEASHEFGNVLKVKYLQSSFPFKMAIEKGFLPAEYRRCYSAWSVSLIGTILSFSSRNWINTVEFPSNLLLEAIGPKRLGLLARSYGFILDQKTCDYPEDDAIYFIRSHGPSYGLS